jgi:hypothetical protein
VVQPRGFVCEPKWKKEKRSFLDISLEKRKKKTNLKSFIERFQTNRLPWLHQAPRTPLEVVQSGIGVSYLQ